MATGKSSEKLEPISQAQLHRVFLQRLDVTDVSDRFIPRDAEDDSVRQLRKSIQDGHRKTCGDDRSVEEDNKPIFDGGSIVTHFVESRTIPDAENRPVCLRFYLEVLSPPFVGNYTKIRPVGKPASRREDDFLEV